MKILKFLFESKSNKKQDYSIGDTVIFDIIKSQQSSVYGFIPGDLERRNGVITNISSKSVRINGNWYIVGYSLGDIIIRDIINIK